jgi:predicted secreted protein
VLLAALGVALTMGGGAIWAAATVWSATAASAVAPEIPAPSGRTVEVHGPDGLPATPIPVRVGDILVVHLREQAGSTGYSWSAGLPGAGLVPIGEQAGPPETSALGAPTEHSFSFRVTREGDAALEFSLRRPWEEAPAQEITVSVAAQA